MTKKIKPSLKDYLKTGKRNVTEPDAAVLQTPDRSGAFLDLLAPPDLQMWEPMLTAGVAVRSLPLDADGIRKDFQSMDGARFTCYALDEKGGALRPVRSESQIHGKLALLLIWDETGALTVYTPDI